MSAGRDRARAGRLPRILLAALLATVVAGPARAAADSAIEYCKLHAPGADEVIAGSPEVAARYGSPTVLVAVTPKGGGPAEAEVLCRYDARTMKAALLLAETDGLRGGIGVAGARVVKDTKRRPPERWFLPVRSGANELVATFRTAPDGRGAVRETSRKIPFAAWVYEVEEWGRLDAAQVFPGREEAEIVPWLLDSKGNLYAVVRSSRAPADAAASRPSTGIVRFDKGGRLAVRYQVGGPDVYTTGANLGGPEGPLGVDAAGNLYVYMDSNILRFDPSGRFAGSLGSVGGFHAVTSAAELARGANFTDSRSTYSAVKYFTLKGMAPPLVGNAFFLLAWREDAGGRNGRMVLTRAGMDGSFAILGNIGDTAGSVPQALVADTRGNLWMGFERDRTRGVAHLSPEGTIVREVTAAGLDKNHPAGQLIDRPLGFAANGDFFFGPSCDRASADFERFAMLPKRQTFRLQGSQGPFDLVTGEDTDKRAVDVLSQIQPSQCLVHGGAAFVLYGDGRLVRFAPEERAPAPVAAVQAPPAPAPAPAPAVAAPAPAPAPAVAAPAAPTLTIARAEGAFDDGIMLDGKAPVPVVARLLDAEGNPLAGVEVGLVVDERGLPRRGRLARDGGAATDRDGTVRALYTPPPIQAPAPDKRPYTVVFQATVSWKGHKVGSAETVVAYASGAVTATVARPGYEAAEGLPVTLRSIRAGTVRGMVVHRAGGKETSGDTPVAGATVRLHGPGGGLLGEAPTGADGRFAIAYAAATTPAATTAPETVLDEPLILSGYDAETAARMKRMMAELARLGGRDPGYRTGSLSTAPAKVFPRRLAAADDEAAQRREIDHLERIDQLVTATRLMDEAAIEAAERWADSMAPAMSGLIGLLDPASRTVDRAALGRLARYKPVEAEEWVRASWFRLASAAVARRLEEKIRGGSGIERTWTMLREEIGGLILAPTLDEFSAWQESVARLGTQVAVSFTAPRADSRDRRSRSSRTAPHDASARWQAMARSVLIAAFRGRAQKHLGEAAQLWETAKLPHKAATGAVFRLHFREMEAHRERAGARRLQPDAYRRDVEAAFQGLSLGARLLGAAGGAIAVQGPAAAAGEGMTKAPDAVRQGFNRLDAGLDAYQGHLWLADYLAAFEMLDSLADAVLREDVSCLGGC